MSRTPLISVILPILNAEPWLARSLDSLLSQTAAPETYEVLAVDNGSSDASREIALQRPRVRLLTEPERGSYAARNRGVRAARGSTFAFMDPDCVADAGWIEAIRAAFEVQGVEVACGLRRPASGSVFVGSAAEYERTKDEWVLSKGDPQIYYGYTCNMAVRKEIFEAMGPFDRLSRGADTLLVRRVASGRSCEAIRFVPDMVVTHLEITSLHVYFRKILVYAFHRSLNNEGRLGSRPLSSRERLMIFRETVRRQRYGIPRAGLLLGILFAGLGFWHAGTLFARLSRLRFPADSRET